MHEKKSVEYWKGRERNSRSVCAVWAGFMLEIFKLSSIFEQKEGSALTSALKRSHSVHSNRSKSFAACCYELLYGFCSDSFCAVTFICGLILLSFSLLTQQSSHVNGDAFKKPQQHTTQHLDSE